MTILQNIKKQFGQFVNSDFEEPSRNMSFEKIVSSQSISLKNSASPKRFLTTPSTQTFEETHKIAYSHGLESIYALENVDVKSVRRISEFQTMVPIIQVEDRRCFKRNECENQWELDLGDEYRGWIEPFLVREPIQVLGLSVYAEKCLIEHGKFFLGDLIKVNLREFVFLKGMGQGHIDEIQRKLYQYLNGRYELRCYSIDFSSWVRTLVSSLDRKKMFLCMEAHHLADLFSLFPIESVEVRRLSLEKRQAMIQEMLMHVQSPERKEAVVADMGKVVNVFVRPWMRRRMGLATKSELVERLEKVSDRVDVAHAVLDFFSAVYFDKRFPLDSYLYEIDQDVYSVDETTADLYHAIVNKATSYFYKSDVTYSFNELVGMVLREFARAWCGFADGFLEKVLRHSSRFRVRKSGDVGQLMISLA